MIPSNQSTGTALATADDVQHAVMESLALKGDISALSGEQKTIYLERLCTSLGLNPLTQPFLPLKLNGKEVLYASRGCTDQLANVHKLTREIIKTEKIEDVYVATCRVSGPDGRFDISTGAVPLGGLKGDALANALMKAETKAKRRATLCYCGLGFLDETEIETIPRDRVEFMQPATKGELTNGAQTSRQATGQAVKAAVERQRLAGEQVPSSEAFSGPDEKAITEGQWSKNIESLSRFVDIDPAPTIAFFDNNPDRREQCYTKVLREVVKKVIAGDDWTQTEDGTTAYLEKCGITAIDKGSRGQLEALILQMKTDGLLG